MIYAIIGPTGVGKTKLSIMLAKKLKAEIINCDSMQIYQELNIGTAKITEEEKEGIIHHLLNIKKITEDYSVFDYQKEGRKIIDKLQKENKNIIVVGGTGLYLKALLYNYDFHSDDKKGHEKVYPSKIVGLTRDRKILYENIDKRVDLMIQDGLIEEVKALYDKKINTRAINTAIGYKELYKYFNGECLLDEAINKIKQASRNYAKRQYTFFNNQFDDITWYNIDEISFENIIEDITKE